MTRTLAVLWFADKMIEQEMAHHREYRPELLAALPQSELDAYAKGERIKAYSLADEIDDRQLCFLRNQRGGFDTHNAATRSLFFCITGIQLPITNRETRAVIRSYCGDVVTAIESRQSAELQTQQLAKELAEQRKRDEAKTKLSAKVDQDEQIDGTDLANLCGMLGVELHPRTIGMLRKRVRGINSDTGRIIGGNIGDSAFQAYRDCRNIIRKAVTA